MRTRNFFAAGKYRPLLATLAIAAGTCAGTAQAADNTYNTLEPGVITVAIEPYMPYTAVENAKLVGLDSDILAAAAAKLGFKVNTKVTDFPGMLASVQSRRVDITIGGIAWSAERQKVGLFTDPPYYSPPALAVHGKSSFPNVKSLEAKTLGTVTGYVWVQAIQQVPGATLRTYPTSNGVFDDLGAGRLDAGFLDPLLIIYEQKQRPELPVHIAYMQAPTAAEIAAHPAYKYFAPYMTGFYVPREEPQLEHALSAQIDAMYQSGEMARLVAKWGGDPKQFLVPSAGMAEQRRGLDRPADWNPPSMTP